MPRAGGGRGPYQVNSELEGFRIRDVVRVIKRVKQINSIYSDGRLAFARVKGEPASARPCDYQLLRRGQTIIWKQVGSAACGVNCRYMKINVRISGERWQYPTRHTPYASSNTQHVTGNMQVAIPNTSHSICNIKANGRCPEGVEGALRENEP